MYIVEFLSNYKKEITTIAVSSPKDIFNLYLCFKNSKGCIAWRIQNYTPEDFGWGVKLEKYSSKFTKEMYND